MTDRLAPDTWLRPLLAWTFVGVVVAAAAWGTVTGQQEGSAVSPGVTIQVEPSGDATWTVDNTVALATESARAAFDETASNETRKERLLANTVGLYRAVASGASERLDRRMRVEATAISLRREGSTGVITVTFRWTRFARIEDGRLLVGDAFAGGFELAANQSLAIPPPDGYELDDHNVSTGEVDDGVVTWEGPATVRPMIELTYREVTPTAAPTTTATEQASPGTTRTPGQPGLGGSAAVLGLLLATCYLRRDRS